MAPRLVIIAFDGCDSDLVEQHIPSLKQAVSGTTSLERYKAQGGKPGGATNECFGQFISGKPIYEIKDLIPFDHRSSLHGHVKTIFDFTDSIAVDVPSWNWHPKHREFHKRTFWAFGWETVRKKVKMGRLQFEEKVKTERRSLTEDLISYLWGEKMNRVRAALAQGSSLTMLYFWFTDLMGHMYVDMSRAYVHVLNVFREIRRLLPPDTIILVMGDHGLQNRHHKKETAFWSLSHPLLPDGHVPELDEWYGLIEKWILNP